MTDTKPLEKRLRESAVNREKDLNFQPDAIVSKTLIDQQQGSITVFAFDKGQSLNEHSAPFDAFVHILDGRMTIRLAGDPVVVSRGQSLIMPADVPHALLANEQTRMLLVMIRS